MTHVRPASRAAVPTVPNLRCIGFAKSGKPAANADLSAELAPMADAAIGCHTVAE